MVLNKGLPLLGPGVDTLNFSGLLLPRGWLSFSCAFHCQHQGIRLLENKIEEAQAQLLLGFSVLVSRYTELQSVRVWSPGPSSEETPFRTGKQTTFRKGLGAC